MKKNKEINDNIFISPNSTKNLINKFNGNLIFHLLWNCLFAYELCLLLFPTTNIIFNGSKLPINTITLMACTFCGFMIAIIISVFFIYKSKIICKILVVVGVISNLLYIIPAKPILYSYLFYLSVSICAILFGTSICIIVKQFSSKTQLHNLMYSGIIVPIIFILINSNFVTKNFILFLIITSVLLILFGISLFLLPKTDFKTIIKANATPTDTPKLTTPYFTYFGTFVLMIITSFVFYSAVSLSFVFKYAYLFLFGTTIIGSITTIFLTKYKIASNRLMFLFFSGTSILGFICLLFNNIIISYIGFSFIGFGLCYLFATSLLGIIANLSKNTKEIVPTILLINFIMSVLIGAVITYSNFIYIILGSIISIVIGVYLFIKLIPYIQVLIKNKEQEIDFSLNSKTFNTLTKTEKLITFYFVNGYTFQQIAEFITCTKKEIDIMFKKILYTLGITNKIDLFKLVFKQD